MLHYFCSWFPAGSIARSTIKTWLISAEGRLSETLGYGSVEAF